jgi:release factor glutamine methyltransferase
VTVAELLVELAGAMPAREGLPDPRAEARWLLAQALGRAGVWLIANPEHDVAPDVEDRARSWAARRAAGEPMHYVVGTCPFWGREFHVSPAVLIPRPETELVVQLALALDLPARPLVADVGTGSGCLAVTLALELPGARVAASEISLEALVVAARHGAAVALVQGDLAHHLRGGYDLVAANLPYVPDDVVASLAPEVRDHEPRIALVGGPDGATLIRAFLADLPRLLRPGAYALLEVGAGHTHALAAEVAAAGLAEVERMRDVAGTERVLVLQRPS